MGAPSINTKPYSLELMTGHKNKDEVLANEIFKLLADNKCSVNQAESILLSVSGRIKTDNILCIDTNADITERVIPPPKKPTI